MTSHVDPQTRQSNTYMAKSTNLRIDGLGLMFGDRGSGIGDRSYLELRAPGMSGVGGDAIAPLERLDQDDAGGEAADVRPERDAAAPALGHDAGDAAEKLERHPVQQHHP